MKQLVSPKQLAQAIGVSESTIKRWCDRGRIQSVRTAGGHRRLRVSSVLQFLRETAREVLDPSALGFPSPDIMRNRLPLENVRERFREALVTGNERIAREVVLNLYLTGVRISVIADEVVAEAFHEIGDLWDCGSVEVFEERRACELTMNLLRDLRMCIPPPSPTAPQALGATPQGDPYTVAVTLAELVLRENGWRAESLGSSVPFESLRAVVADVQPRLLWLSVSHIVDETLLVDEIGRLFDVCTATGTALAVGGRALDEGVRKRLRYTSFGDTMQHLEQFAGLLFAPARSLQHTS